MLAPPLFPQWAYQSCGAYQSQSGCPAPRLLTARLSPCSVQSQSRVLLKSPRGLQSLRLLRKIPVVWGLRTQHLMKSEPGAALSRSYIHTEPGPTRWFLLPRCGLDTQVGVLRGRWHCTDGFRDVPEVSHTGWRRATGPSYIQCQETEGLLAEAPAHQGQPRLPACYRRRAGGSRGGERHTGQL